MLSLLSKLKHIWHGSIAPIVRYDKLYDDRLQNLLNLQKKYCFILITTLLFKSKVKSLYNVKFRLLNPNAV